MNKEQHTPPSAPTVHEEEELNIDFMAYARQLWAGRKWLIRMALLGAAVGIAVALCTPKQYTVQVTLAPEMSGGSTSSLAGMAAMLGMGNVSLKGETDALNVNMYPDLVASTPFILELFATPVSPLTKKGDTEVILPLEAYLKEQTGSPIAWAANAMGKLLGGIVELIGGEKEEEGEDVVNPFRLTPKQNGMVEDLRKNVFCEIDKKMGTTTVSVTLPDAQVAAQIADVVVKKLQELISTYRTTKAQQNCDYLEQLYKDRQDEYYTAQEKYARYADANRSVILLSVLSERERLQNDMNLAFQIYSQVAQQLQMARAQVQEAKPAFAVVEPATVPIRPSGTSRRTIFVGFIFLAVAGASAWILFGAPYWQKLKEELQSIKSEQA